MNITTLMNTLRNAIHDDTATQAWCTTAYKQNHHVYVGVDQDNLPPVGDYPLVHLFPMRKNAGYNLSKQEHGIEVTCGIYDATVRSTDKANVIEYTGVANIEAFRKLVETVVAANVGTLTAGTVEIEYSPVEAFPYFLAGMIWTLDDEYYQGDDVFD